MTEADSDQALMVRIVDGDRAAFDGLVRRHGQRLLAVAARMVGNASDAEDVVQEACLRIWRGAATWRPETAAFSTWSYRIVINLCIDRARRRPWFAPIEDAGDPPDERPDALDAVQRASLGRRIGEALAGLPDRQRAALTLSYYEGLSGTEAAEVLSISVSALESLLVRGRRALRARLAELGIDGMEDLP